MCSQSGNLQDLSACSDHSILDSDTDIDNSSRQDLVHPPPLPPDMVRYMTNSTIDDVRFNQDSGNTHSPIYSIEPSVQTSSSAALAYLPYSHLYQPSLTGSSYSSPVNSYFPPSSTLFSVPDIKPRLNSLNPPVASRSPALPHPASPLTTRDLYTGSIPQLRRTSDLLSRSPSAAGTVRGLPLSPASSGGFTSSSNMESSLGVQPTPPLLSTEVIHQFQSADGQIIRPEIFARIEKGFFMADNDWTCYRRNYFSLQCSYTLRPAIPTGSIHLCHLGGATPAVLGFSMSIAAVVDGRDGKNIELVQHTPKRDKGPQEKPPRVSLSPKPPPSMGGYGANSSLSRGLYDQSYSPNSQSTTEANFERIQFKNATANNGKRRAAQQYYHIVVELYADVGNQHPDQWIKVASRISAPMVVRGRSPGHYQGERRGSNASTGPGGSGGSGGAGSYTPSNTSRNGDMNISGSSILPAAGYNNSYEGRNHHYRPPIPPSQVPMEPTLSHEDAKGIEEAPGYVYYPGAIWEGYEGHNHLPSMGEHNMNKIKQEYNSNSNGYVLPSLTNIQEGFGRHCGRWDGAPESKGYFPTAFVQQTMNIS